MAGKSDVIVRFIGDTAGLDKAMGKAQTSVGKMGGVFSKVGSQIGGEFGTMLAGVGDSMNQVGEKGKNLGMKLSVAGGVATGLGLELMKMGSKPKQAMDQLATAVTNTGSSIADYKDGIDEAIKKQQNFGHSELDTMAALQKLTQSTNSPKKALSEMGLVADLAAAQHISLADAAGMVSKIIAGKGARALAAYGITMQKTGATAKQVEKAHHDVEKAAAKLAAAHTNLGYVQEVLGHKSHLTASEHVRLERAQQKVRDAAFQVKAAQQAYANTQEAAKNKTKDATQALGELSGKINGQASASVNNFGARIGIIRTKLGDWAGQMGGKLGPILTSMGPLLMVIGALVQMNAFAWIKDTASKVANLAVTTAMRVQFMLISVATKAWTAAQWLLNVAMDANPIGLVVIAVAALIAGFILMFKHVKWFREGVLALWHGVKAAFGGIWDAIKFVFDWVKGHWQLILAILTGPIGLAILFLKNNWGKVTQIFGDVINGIKTVFSNVFRIITWPFRTAFNFVADMWNKTLGKLHFHIPKILGFGGFDLQMPQLPHLAKGGIVSSPTVALIGEAGPEAVVPLNGKHSMGGNTYIVNLHGGILNGTPMENARALARILQQGQGGGLRLGFNT